MAYEDQEDAKLDDKIKKQKALDLVKSRFNVSKHYTETYFSKFQDLYKLYRSQLEGRLPWRSNLFIAKSFEIVETIAPRIAQAQRTFKALPVEGMDVMNAEAYTDLLKFQFSKTNMEDVIEELVKESLIYGTAVAKISWKDKMPNPEVVDIFDFYPDPKARFQEEMKYAIHRLEKDLEDLKKNKNYDKDALEKLEYSDGKSEEDEQRLQRDSVTGTNRHDGTRKRYEILEYWGEFMGKPYIIVVANGKVVLRCDENPYADPMPFVVVRDTIVPHEFYGIGEIEPVQSLQYELNDIRNQRMDNTKINVNRMWKVLPGGVLDESELIYQPGGIIHVTRQDGLLPNDTQPIPSEAFTEESIIKSDMERITGANSPLSGALVSPMGGNQGGVINRTATAWQGAINQADKRFNSKINQMKRGLIKIGRKFLELDQQFMTEPQMIRILGEGGRAAIVQLLPEDIKAGFDLDVEIEYLDEFQRLQQDMGIAEVAKQIPGFDLAKFLVDTLERNGKKGVERYLKKPEPPAPERPKLNYSLRGDMAPDAVAQVLDKYDNIKSNPKVVGAKMREAAGGEAEQAAKIEDQLTQAQNGTTQG